MTNSDEAARPLEVVIAETFSLQDELAEVLRPDREAYQQFLAEHPGIEEDYNTLIGQEFNAKWDSFGPYEDACQAAVEGGDDEIRRQARELRQQIEENCRELTDPKKPGTNLNYPDPIKPGQEAVLKVFSDGSALKDAVSQDDLYLEGVDRFTLVAKEAVPDLLQEGLKSLDTEMDRLTAQRAAILEFGESL